MDWLTALWQTLVDTLGDVVPIVAVLFGFQLGVLRQRISQWRPLLLGLGCVILGLALFLVGLEQALFPLGELMAAQLTAPEFLPGDGAWWHYYWVYLFAFAVGFATTIAEPSLIAVAMKASEVSGNAIHPWGLRIAVALGVALGIALGSYRIVVGDPLHWYILGGYLVVVVQTRFAPQMIIPLAYDSGGVTTSTVTVPLVAALGLGLASAIPGRSPLLDGFGLIAFASLFPIITVMGYAQLTLWLHQRNQRTR
ncbi:DUF1538 domain-containing protein [Ferrimonas balearica]|uniref:DUF1538 domain-containing protein n=1 Tax=Ferrimonas balearica TaxID=44012 RepID=UPI001C957058|nr:DUF1538 domain-containing protein [Ferrimonas balearica]MBY6224805.1 DUF1538 domain-containing protein [Ferrimonas balearica]